MTHDAIVVGGGPAGATAAFHLAKAGRNVVLLEKERLPRYKTCGGGVLPRACAFFGFPIDEAVEAACSTAQVNFWNGGGSHTVTRPRPLILMTMRDRLDHLLVQAAASAGAQVRTGCTAEAIREREKGVEVSTPEGKFSARFLIAADGARSAAARLAGWPENPHRIPALEAEVTLPELIHSRFRDTARFDFGPVPSGYGWVFPKKNHLSIGVLSMMRGPVSLPQCLNDYLSKLGLGKVPEKSLHGYVIPLGPRRPLARGRILLTGDAAGLVDPITGEGISLAAASGFFAAQAVIRSDGRPRRAAAIYERSVGTLEETGWLRRMLAHILYFRPGLTRKIFARHGSKLCELMCNVMTGEKKLSRLLRNPLRYCRLFG